jgi:quercetin dioxygenase-like cupin family protein
MWRQRALATLVLFLALILPLAAPLGVAAADPPAPTARHLYRTAGLPAPGPMEVVQFLFELPPGAATPLHTHPGLTLGTVIQGEVTFEIGGATTIYKVGDTIIERPGDAAGAARNATAATTLVVVSMVVPQGATASIPQPGAPVPSPAPVTRYLFRTPAIIPTGAYDLAQQVLDFAPGAATPVHTHPGQAIVTVLAGENLLTYRGVDTHYTVGDSFVEQPGVVAQARNAGSGPMTVFVAFLLPKGAPLSNPVTTPGLPATGGGGTAERLSLPLVTLLGGVLLLAGGWRLRRRLGRS